MNTKSIAITPTESLGSTADARDSINWARFSFEIVFTLVLTGLLLWRALNPWPAIPGKAKHPAEAILIVTVLPFVSLVVLSLIERLFAPAGPRKSARNWFLHLQMNVFWALVATFTYAFAAIASAKVAHHFGYSLGLIDLRFSEGNGILALVGAVWLSAIVGDFFFYWYHRTLHKVPFLWQLHKLHHMDPELDILTINRDNWIDAVVAAFLISVPLGLVFKLDSLDPWELGLMGGIIATVFSTLLGLGHMNVRLQVGKASVLYGSPQVHRIHHSRLPQHFDRNFAFILPLWDVLFGTYYAPARDEFPPTGVPGETNIRSFWEAEIFTSREWWRMFRAWRERKAGANANLGF